MSVTGTCSLRVRNDLSALYKLEHVNGSWPADQLDRLEVRYPEVHVVFADSRFAEEWCGVRKFGRTSQNIRFAGKIEFTHPTSTRKQEKVNHGDHNAAHQDQVRASCVPRSRRDSHPLLHAHGHRFIAVMSRIVRWSPTTSRKEVNSPSARDPSPAQKVLGGK